MDGTFDFIAVSRHIIQLDFEHTGGLELIGIGVLVIALAAGYFLVKRNLGRTGLHRRQLADEPTQAPP